MSARGLIGIVVAGAALVLLTSCEGDRPSVSTTASAVDENVPIQQDAGDARCRLATAQSPAGADCPNGGDADHDGVADGEDRCPDTTPGIAVDASGCATIPD